MPRDDADHPPDDQRGVHAAGGEGGLPGGAAGWAFPGGDGAVGRAAGTAGTVVRVPVHRAASGDYCAAVQGVVVEPVQRAGGFREEGARFIGLIFR